jgi:hypothetical protein
MKRTILKILFGGSFLIIFISPAKAFEQIFFTKVGIGQFQNNFGINDVWTSPKEQAEDEDLYEVDLGPGGDFYEAKFKLDKFIELDDGYADGDESIHFKLFAESQSGETVKIDYEFKFLGNSKPLLINPINGTIEKDTMTYGNNNITLDRNINLISGGKFSFNEIHLKLSPNTNQYRFADIQIGVDADNVSISPVPPVPPVPGPLPILGIGAAFGYSRKLRKRLKSSKP